MNDLSKITKSLNDMPLHERMQYQGVYDSAVILQASMQRTKVKLKTLSNKRSHPFALENMKND